MLDDQDPPGLRALRDATTHLSDAAFVLWVQANAQVIGSAREWHVASFTTTKEACLLEALRRLTVRSTARSPGAKEEPPDAR